MYRLSIALLACTFWQGALGASARGAEDFAPADPLNSVDAAALQTFVQRQRLLQDAHQ